MSVERMCIAIRGDCGNCSRCGRKIPRWQPCEARAGLPHGLFSLPGARGGGRATRTRPRERPSSPSACPGRGPAPALAGPPAPAGNAARHRPPKREGPTAPEVRHHAADGRGRVALVGSDETDRPALDPPRHVLDRAVRAAAATTHAALGAGYDTPPIIEREAGKTNAAIADGAEHQIHRHHVGDAGPHGSDRPLPVRHEPAGPDPTTATWSGRSALPRRGFALIVAFPPKASRSGPAAPPPRGESAARCYRAGRGRSHL